MEVRDGLETLSKSLAPRLCGYTVPGNVESSSNTMLVRFVTDGSVFKSGFSAIFIEGNSIDDL